MTERAIKRLEALADADPTAAPLARLQVEILHAVSDPHWDDAVPALEPNRIGEGVPLLHERTLTVDPKPARQIVARLASLAQVSLKGRGRSGEGLEALAFLEASIAADTARLEMMATGLAVDLPMLATLGQLAVFPLLQACGRRASTLLEGAHWEEGFCPVCAAWPVLAEVRGLERQRRLRCGRCGAGWSVPHQRCAYCQNSDHRTLGYLAPEDNPEPRRALTCERCRGYLKVLATITPMAPEEIAVQDLATLELDVAALERGFGRPERPGFPLRVELTPVARRNGWLRWRR